MTNTTSFPKATLPLTLHQDHNFSPSNKMPYTAGSDDNDLAWADDDAAVDNVTTWCSHLASINSTSSPKVSLLLPCHQDYDFFHGNKIPYTAGRDENYLAWADDDAVGDEVNDAVVSLSLTNIPFSLL